MYICPNVSIDSDVDEYPNVVEYFNGDGMELCDGIFSISHLNRYKIFAH